MLSFKNSTKELSDSTIDTAIISVGSTEQCGPHLPLHIDTLLVEYFARTFGERLNAYVLPALPFNTSEEHASFRGTITLRATTMMQIIEEIVAVLRTQGFRKQVLAVGHGGAYWRTAFIKHINWLYQDIVVVDAHIGGDEHWQQGLERAGLAGRGEIHGGALSKALALYLAPDCVTEGEYGQTVSEQLREVMDYCTWDKITSDGSWGRFSNTDADIATAEAGRMLLEYFVAHQSRRLQAHLEEACRIKGTAS